MVKSKVQQTYEPSIGSKPLVGLCFHNPASYKQQIISDFLIVDDSKVLKGKACYSFGIFLFCI